MAVLCEAYSVIVRKESIDQYLPGGQAAFTELVANDTYCSDGSLVRAGFMTPDDVKAFVDALEVRGLQFLIHEGTVSMGIHGRRDSDIVVVDQGHGPTTACPWINCFRMQISAAGSVVGARLVVDGVPEVCADGRVDLHVPEGWTYEGSISAEPHFVEAADIPRRMRFLRREHNLEVYLDTETGQEMFVGRSTVPR